MQAIITHFLPPTNVKGARIVARASGGTRAIIGYRNDLSVEEAHREAAMTLCSKLGWTADIKDLATGYFEGVGYVHVLTEATHGH